MNLQLDGDYMEYLIGALIVVAFFIALFSGVYIGYRLKHTKTKPPDVDDQQKQHMQQLKRDFDSLMSYSVAKATERKKV
jgi:hypothetical protein